MPPPSPTTAAASGFEGALALALAANPGIDVMVSCDAATTPANVRACHGGGTTGGTFADGPPRFAHAGVDDHLGIALVADALAPKQTTGIGHTLSGTRTVETLSMASIDAACPFTSFADYQVPSGDSIDVYLPKLSAFRGDSLVDLTPDGVGALGAGVGIDTDGDGVREPDWHIYVATFLVCDDMLINLPLLGRPPASAVWYGSTIQGLIRPYDRPDISFLALRTTESASSGPTWSFSPGVAGEGEFIFAYHAVAHDPAADPADEASRESPGARTGFLKFARVARQHVRQGLHAARDRRGRGRRAHRRAVAAFAVDLGVARSGGTSIP